MSEITNQRKKKELDKIEKAQKSGKACHNMFVKLRSHDYLAIKGVPIGKTIYKKVKFYQKLHEFYLQKNTFFFSFRFLEFFSNFFA